RSDLYSLACVTYEMLAGATPFTGTTVSAMLRQHLIENPPSITRVRPDIAEGIGAALQRGMAKTPEERFVTAAEFATALHTGTTPPAVQVVPPRPRRRGLILALGIGAIAVATGLLLREPSQPAAAISQSAVAVLPFTVRGNDSLQLGEGMVTLLSTKLDGAGDLRTVDARALLSYLEREPVGTMNVEEARKVAGRFSAGMFVLGDVVILGNHVQLSAGVYDRDKHGVMQQASVEGSIDTVFGLVDALAAKLLAERSGPSGAGLDRVASVTTASLPAFKAYLDGERNMRTGNFDRAALDYQRAVAADSGFALAWYRLGTAALWLVQDDLITSSLGRAEALSAHLPERIRLLLQAIQAARAGNFVRAEQLYRTITGASPDDVEAWLQLGELLFHDAPLNGRDFRDSREPWRRVMALEPDNIIPLVHLARVEAADRDTAALTSLVSQISAIRARSGQDSSGARVEELEMAMLRAAAVHDTDAITRLLGDLGRTSELTQTLTSWDVAMMGGDLGTAYQIAGLLRAPSRSGFAQALGCRIRSSMLLGMGKRKAADQELDQCLPLDPGLIVAFRAYYAALPMPPAPAGRLDKERTALDSVRQPTVDPTPENSTFITVHTGGYQQVRMYLEGLYGALADDTAQANRAAALLPTLPGSAMAQAAEGILSDGIRAEVAYRQQRWDDALRLLNKSRVAPNYLIAGSSPFFSGSRERFRLADLLARAGQNDEAIRWYSSFDNLSMFDTPLLAPSLLRKAEIYQRQGKKPEAIKAYQRFVELWRDADAELQPWVTQARERIQALQVD
ncbi:MAG: tetratricopeptide repeat protein, partial [Gammaproteobacteria bacterium]